MELLTGVSHLSILAQARTASGANLNSFQIGGIHPDRNRQNLNSSNQAVRPRAQEQEKRVAAGLVRSSL